MAADERSPTSEVQQSAWQPLVAEVETLLHTLQGLERTFGPALAQLAMVNWRQLASQGYLPGVHRLVVERTIEDARTVLTRGQQVLTEVLQQAQNPEIVAQAHKGEIDIPERLRAAIRLYMDTPNDIRNRCQRLTNWLTAMAQAQQQAGEPALMAQVGWPQPG
jgi:hypothetical protein